MGASIEGLEARTLMAVDLQGLDLYATDTARWGQVIAASPFEIKNIDRHDGIRLVCRGVVYFERRGGIK
jgi:hypothetical protein